jgi:receptor protein-tyrosine kinase
MNIIEEATKRLQQLEKAGIQTPGPEAHDRLREMQHAEPTPQLAVRAAQARVRVPAPIQALDGRREPVLASETPSGANARNIDLAALRAAGFITPGMADSKLLHEFRVIKRPLIQNALGKTAGPVAKGNLIMITSSLAGEGKSFVSLNLAMSIAMEVDCRVLLVDGDVIKPSLPRLLGLQPAKGLMDVLTTPSLGLGDVLIKTNVPSLDLVLAGTPHGEASELLASEALRNLLEEISSRYPDRIVIFDSPPLLATTESRVLASHMGQVVVVVEAERATHSTLESALSTLEGCPVVLTILNKAPASDSASYYGYYGYGH